MSGDGTSPPGTEVVRAAGGVVVRTADHGPEILLVHRPKYDDWSFPKGKCDPGETSEDTARREVEEETGLTCTLEAPLPEVRYRDQQGRLKVVRYWMMRPVEDAPDRFAPNEEVDRRRWCAPEAADRLLTYDHDRALLARVVTERPQETGGGPG